MNLRSNLLTIEGNGIIGKNRNMNLLSIGEHEVKGVKLWDLISGVDKWVAEDNKGIKWQEVSFDLVMVLVVDRLVWEEFELIAETLWGDVGADVVSFEGGHVVVMGVEGVEL